MKKFSIKMPHVLTLIMLLITIMAILTWVVPSGTFQRHVVDTMAGEREVVIAGTYEEGPKVLEDGTDLRQGIPEILTAPAKGLQNAIEVLAFAFIIGGVFAIMAKTNALNMAIQKMIEKLGSKEILIISILMIIFSLEVPLSVCQMNWFPFICC